MKKKIAKLKRNIKHAPLSAYVVFSISMVLIYTVVITVMTALTDCDYSTLYTVFCSIFGGEILFSALIKIFKLKGDNENE